MNLIRALEIIFSALTYPKNRYIFFVISSALLMSGCLGTKQLKEDEKLLYKQRINAPRGINKYALQDLYATETNKKFLGAPIHSLVTLYYTGKNGILGIGRFNPERIQHKIETKEKKFDAKIAKAKSNKRINNLRFRKQSKIATLNEKLTNGNLWMRWGEPVAVYDSTKRNLTAEKFRDYLFTHGYFKNKVSTRVEARTRKTVNVYYDVEPGRPYLIDTIDYRIPDSALMDLILKTKQDSYLKKGKPYNQDDFSSERERIDLLFKEHGYYDFSRQYVEFEIDTTYGDGYKIATRVIINDPAKRGYHKKFIIDEVRFTTDAGVTLPGASRQKEEYRGTEFLFFEKKYSPKILSQRTFIHPGDAYSREKTFSTQRQLANLDVFKFVNINYDTSGGRFIANVFTSALERYQWSNEIGVNVTQGFPGPYYNINFKKRNIFRGLENFELNGRIGYEGVASATETSNVYQSIEAGINASITFPQFIFPLKEETRFKLGRINPRTKALIGFTYTDRPEYTRSATTFNYIYRWENQRIRRFDLTLTNLSIINSKTDSLFQNLLDSLFINEGNTLFRTFEPSFVSSIIFNMSWNHNNYGNLDENSIYFRWSFESGGTLQNLVDYPIIENQRLQSFRYLRINGDIRRINVLNKNTTLAYRLNAGLGYSYDDKKALPYEKYFFAGGSNSVRAWRPRRLGPGSFRPIESVNPENDGLFDYRYEQPGEVLIEGSIELRRKLVGIFEGAVFFDIGNVWTIEPRLIRDSDGNIKDNGNSQFKVSEFYKEFGMGTGLGLRFNFSFLILRFDAGVKVYDPARPMGERFVLDKAKFFGPFGRDKEPVIYNVGVGFPF